MVEVEVDLVWSGSGVLNDLGYSRYTNLRCHSSVSSFTNVCSKQKSDYTNIFSS